MNHGITLTAAATMTQRYRQQRELILDPLYQNQNVLPLSETFSRAALDALLAKTGCTGMRIYYGMDEDNKLHAVLVGVDDANNDILPPASLAGEPEDDTYVYDLALRCPPACPEDGPLNAS